MKTVPISAKLLYYDSSVWI